MVRSIECGRYVCTYQSYVVVDVVVVVAITIAIVVTVGSCIFSITFPVYAPSLTLLGRISLSFAIKYSQFRTKYLLNQPNKHMSVEASDKIHHAILSICIYSFMYREREWERKKERGKCGKVNWLENANEFEYAARWSISCARDTQNAAAAAAEQHSTTSQRIWKALVKC